MFFTYFKQIMSPDVDYNLTISQTAAGELVVIMLPKVRDLKDAAQHQIGPLKLSGSPQDLDREFFPSVTAPIQKTAGILLDMKNYEKQQDAATAESKAAKDEKNKAATEAKAKKDKYDGFMKKAGELETAGDLDNALIQLQQARLHATDKAVKAVDEKIAALKGKMNQGSLFDAPAVQPTATAPAASPQPAPVAPQPAASPWPAMDAPAYRGNEYEEIVDFPSEMLPPVYNGGMAAGAM